MIATCARSFALRTRKLCTDNELVLDANVWTDGLPHIIEAIVFPAYASKAHIAAARKMHERFVAEFRLNSQETPLLRYDPSDAAGTPFSVA